MVLSSYVPTFIFCIHGSGTLLNVVGKDVGSPPKQERCSSMPHGRRGRVRVAAQGEGLEDQLMGFLVLEWRPGRSPARESKRVATEDGTTAEVYRYTRSMVFRHVSTAEVAPDLRSPWFHGVNRQGGSHGQVRRSVAEDLAMNFPWLPLARL